VFNQNGVAGQAPGSPIDSLGDLRVGGRRLEDLLGEILHTHAPESPDVPSRLRVTSGDADNINLHAPSPTGSWNRIATDRSVPMRVSPTDLGGLMELGVVTREGESAAASVPSLVQKLLALIGER